jgi:hypothetical protein
VQRKSVQLALKQQRQQMAAATSDHGDGNQQQDEQYEANSSEEAATASTARPRIGQWGSAKAFSEPTGASSATGHVQPGAKPLFARQQGSSCSRGVLQQCSNTQHDLAHSAAAVDAAAGCSSTATGVKAPAGPAAVPQLRKRLAKPLLGAFKAPRMTAPAVNSSSSSADSSSKCVAVDGHVEQQQDVAGELTKQGSSCLGSDGEQQQQQEDIAVEMALGAAPAASSKQQQPGASSTGTIASSRAPCSIGRVGLQGLRGRASGRHAFVPPLKRS